MFGLKLPILIRLNKVEYHLNVDASNSFILVNETGTVLCKFVYKMPSYLASHIRNFFNDNLLPSAHECTFYHCRIKDDNLFLFYVLMRYVEKYREYVFPLIFNLSDQTYYMSGQSIYYNHDQKPWVKTNSETPVLEIRTGSDKIVESFDMEKIFKLNPPPEIYRILYKKGKDSAN